MTKGQWSYLIEKYGCTRTGLILKPCYVVMFSCCDEDWLTWLLGGGQSAKVADCKVHLLTLLSCIIQWVICVAWRGYLLTTVLMMLSSTVVTLYQQWWCPWFNKMRAGNLCSEPPPRLEVYTIITMNNIIHQVPGWQKLFSYVRTSWNVR